MLGKNLKYYRLKSHMSMKELAQQVGVSQMAISNYENGKRMPEIQIVRKLLDVLGIKLADLMRADSDNRSFNHGSFRKNSALSKNDQAMVHGAIEDYLGRFISALELVGVNAMPAHPELHSIAVCEDDEKNARDLCQWLGIAPDGAIGPLVDLVENNGIIICQLEIDNDAFSGLNGTVNEIPYVAINTNMTPERQRFTIIHELAHMAFMQLNDKDDKQCERRVNSIAGHVLFSDKSVYRELGYQRSSISRDMIVTAKEYGISMLCLAYRARDCQVVSDNSYESFMKQASRLGWRKNEPSRIAQEKSSLFKQLVYRAIEEGEISVQRGAELLCVPFDQVKSEMQY